MPLAACPQTFRRLSPKVRGSAASAACLPLRAMKTLSVAERAGGSQARCGMSGAATSAATGDGCHSGRRGNAGAKLLRREARPLRTPMRRDGSGNAVRVPHVRGGRHAGAASGMPNISAEFLVWIANGHGTHATRPQVCGRGTVPEVGTYCAGRPRRPRRLK